jgi:hypothetical protein
LIVKSFRGKYQRTPSRILRGCRVHGATGIGPKVLRKCHERDNRKEVKQDHVAALIPMAKVVESDDGFKANFGMHHLSFYLARYLQQWGSFHLRDQEPTKRKRDVMVT